MVTHVGPYREDREALLARCEALNKENMQLQWKLIQKHNLYQAEMRNMQDRLNRMKVERDSAGNLVGELSHQNRELRVRSGKQKLSLWQHIFGATMLIFAFFGMYLGLQRLLGYLSALGWF